MSPVTSLSQRTRAHFDETLREAESSLCGVAACWPEAVGKLSVVLTTCDLSRDLHIVTRAVYAAAEPKPLKAASRAHAF